MTIYRLVLLAHPNHFVTGQPVLEQWNATESSAAICEALHNYILKPFASRVRNQLFSPLNTHFRQAQGHFYTGHSPIFQGFTTTKSAVCSWYQTAVKPGLNLCVEFYYQLDTPCLLRHLRAIWSFVKFYLAYLVRINLLSKVNGPPETAFGRKMNGILMKTFSQFESREEPKSVFEPFISMNDRSFLQGPPFTSTREWRAVRISFL